MMKAMSRDSDSKIESQISDSEAPDPNKRPECFRSTLQECLFVFTTTMAVGMTTFLMGAVTIISSFVGRDLGMTTAEITWMNAASALSSGAFLLFFGSFADLFGRKAMFIGSLACFSIFNVAAGFSKSGLTLDILNFVLGLFSASALPPAQGILGVVYDQPSRRKNRVFACFSAGNPLGFAIGAILAGVSAHLFDWRAGFWVLGLVYGIVTVIALLTTPRDMTVKEPWGANSIKRLDIPGTLLAVLGIGMFCASLSLGSEARQGFKTPYVLVLLILGATFISAFIVWEIRYPYAMLPMNIWKNRDFSILILVLCLGFLGFSVYWFWLGLYFESVLNYSPLETGLRMLPIAVVGLSINCIAAFVLHRVSNKLLMGVGALAYVVSFVLAAVQKSGASYWAFAFPSMCLSVIGADSQFNVANMYVLSSLPLSRQSIAGSLLQTLTRLSTAIGYGIATAIFNKVQETPTRQGYYNGDAVEPYAATWWFSAGIAAVTLPLVPWLRIRTQGNSKDTDLIDPQEKAHGKEMLASAEGVLKSGEMNSSRAA